MAHKKGQGSTNNTRDSNPQFRGTKVMHKTQGFGASPYRGESIENLEYTVGDTAFTDIFDSIETSWKRVSNSSAIQESVNNLIKNYDYKNPHKSVKGLVNLYKILDLHKKDYWVEIKKAEVKNLLLMVNGFWMDANALKESVSPGDEINIRTTVLKRSEAEVIL